MKLPYIQEPPIGLSAKDQAIYERIQARRGGTLLPLDKALFHSPEFADGWNSMLGAVRTRGVLSTDIREICICRPALHNRAWFEWKHHAPLLAEAEGFTSDMMQVVSTPNPKSQGPLNDKQWAVLRYSDAMTTSVDVPQDIFGALAKAGFNNQEIVEITITCAAYNMVSRFLVALDVGEMNGHPPQSVSPADDGKST
ncbi:hypothetical protein PV10_02683 [Exophiala mesophila]|uniref:Carboxymuconolactone decarboxylase-like domain-containing protein n=1 Tax=Exophiala mesophila TaxID=212818 RepID=A0A0D1WZN4_EXOME|nr:uncharacterized protein PV10_02683 [Exophiala mesophila]KIV94970.1 hypothetical protein PV10_02683 [Exophiala mesophila]